MITSEMRQSHKSMTAQLIRRGFNKKELRSEIEINASPEEVWKVLTDFAKFSEWNPFIRIASGKVIEGEKLQLTMHPSGGRTTIFKPTVVKVTHGKELRWLGHYGMTGIFDGQHIFELNSTDSGSKTHFVQREEFGGILVPFLTGMLKHETSRGFNEMNQALKERVEANVM